MVGLALLLGYLEKNSPYHAVSKNSTNMHYHIVLSAISALYLLCFTDYLIQWYFIDLTLVANGETRKSIFLAIMEPPQWIWVLTDILVYSSFIVSDGLLVGKYIWSLHHSY